MDKITLHKFLIFVDTAQTESIEFAVFALMGMNRSDLNSSLQKTAQKLEMFEQAANLVFQHYNN